jgi:hypothetical protein
MSSQEPGLTGVVTGLVPAGHEVARKVFARGVQVYEWDGASWRFVGPLADLYDLDDQDVPRREKAGTHYMHLNTPAWEFPAGQVIVERAQAVPGAGPKDIDWLRVELRQDEANRRALNYSHVLRLRTRLGRAPDAEVYPGGYKGQRVGMSYETYYAFLKRTG